MFRISTVDSRILKIGILVLALSSLNIASAVDQGMDSKPSANMGKCEKLFVGSSSSSQGDQKYLKDQLKKARRAQADGDLNGAYRVLSNLIAWQKTLDDEALSENILPSDELINVIQLKKIELIKKNKQEKVDGLSEMLEKLNSGLRDILFEVGIEAPFSVGSRQILIRLLRDGEYETDYKKYMALDKALILIEGALEEKSNFHLQWIKVELLSERGKYQDAKKYIEHLLKIEELSEANNSALKVKKLDILIDSGKTKPIMIALDDMVSLRSQFTGKGFPDRKLRKAIRKFSDELSKKGDLDKSLEVLKLGNSVYPNNPIILFKMALLEKEIGSYSKALELLKEQLSRVSEPEYQSTNLGLQGHILRELGRFDEAIKSLKESIRLNPQNQGSIDQLSYVEDDQYELGSKLREEGDIDKRLEEAFKNLED